MGPYDNPSADKFGPPPGQERFEPPKPRRSAPWIGVVFALALLLAQVALDYVHVTGWMAGAVIAAIFGIAVGDFIVAKHARDRREEANRPGTHQITLR